VYEMKHGRIIFVLSVALLAAAGAVEAQQGAKAYKALGLKPQDVLTGTVLKSRVLPSEEEQVVCIATYLTGKGEKADAVNVRLGVFDTFGEGLVTLYARDFGEDLGGYVANGDLLVMDIDRNGVNEIIVSFDDFSDPLIQQRSSCTTERSSTRRGPVCSSTMPRRRLASSQSNGVIATFGISTGGTRCAHGVRPCSSRRG